MANATHAIRAEAGIVMSHAATMFAPTPQRTAPRLRLAPTPSTEPVTTCVVLTGRPMRVAPWMTLAPISCAEKPVAGSSLKMLQPSVRIIRHPPAYVPKPIGGEMTRLATCLTSADHWTPPSPPAAATPAPHKPPINACVELLGSPRYHVRRFHVMAPKRADMTTTRPGLIASVLAIVFDTLAWKKATVITAPTRLKTAARPTAVRGDSARVEIDVAIALAVSWKPFVKSNATASPIVTQSRIAVSCILDRDGLHHVGRMLACIHRLLEPVVDG